MHHTKTSIHRCMEDLLKKFVVSLFVPPLRCFAQSPAPAPSAQMPAKTLFAPSFMLMVCCSLPAAACSRVVHSFFVENLSSPSLLMWLQSKTFSFAGSESKRRSGSTRREGWPRFSRGPADDVCVVLSVAVSSFPSSCKM